MRLARGGQKIVTQRVAFRLAKRIGRPGQEVGQSVAVVNLGDFAASQFAIKNAEVIDESFREPNVAESLPNHDRVAATAGDVLV